MIDAHVHIWRLERNDCTWPTPDLPIIHRDFGLADVEETIAGTDIRRVVLVQSHESERDTVWLLEEASASTVAAGVVGWLEPTDHIGARMDKARAAGPLAGLRVMAQDRAADWLDQAELQPQFAAMAERNLALDLLVRPRHLPSSIDLARRFPSLRMVIDHCAKPAITQDGLAAWREAIAPAADRPNMMCKMSGLITEAEPGAAMEALVPFVEAAFALFGPDRLIWGSDWPVILLNGAYRDWLALAKRVIPGDHRDAVFGGNARRFYRLG